MQVEEFGELFSSLMRIKAREDVAFLMNVCQGNHGDKKSLKGHIKAITAWLPKIERGGPKGNAKAFEQALKRK